MSEGNSGGAVARAQDNLGQAMERVLSAAQAGAVFGLPVQSGSYTVINACEVVAGGGFGYGGGTGAASTGGVETGGEGGGGGGGAHGRPVAAIVIGPDGVYVKPIVDVGKLALAGLTASIAALTMLMRLRRAQRG